MSAYTLQNQIEELDLRTYEAFNLHQLTYDPISRLLKKNGIFLQTKQNPNGMPLTKYMREMYDLLRERSGGIPISSVHEAYEIGNITGDPIHVLALGNINERISREKKEKVLRMLEIDTSELSPDDTVLVKIPYNLAPDQIFSTIKRVTWFDAEEAKRRTDMRQLTHRYM